ncbi:MAG: ATP-binding protein [Candidatus Eisenbacteria bacterium]
MASEPASRPELRIVHPSHALAPGSDLARIEHSLRSLLELGRELTVSLDLHQTADLLMFNLMGQLGTGRAALWLLPEDAASTPVMIRCHGFERADTKRAGEVSMPVLMRHFERSPSPITLAELGDRLEGGDVEAVRRADLQLFAPLVSQKQILGWLSLGSKLSAAPYSEADVQVLQAALGMVAVTLQNTRLHNQMRQTNRELRASNFHLQELDTLKSEFVRNVNHELRTPLAVIMATLECVVDAGTGDERLQSMLGTALTRARHLNGLLEKLLTFSNAMNAQLTVELAEEDVALLLRSFCQQRRADVMAGLRDLSLTCADDLPHARCDRQRVVQILDQLLENALKFTPSGAHLRLRAGTLTDGGQRWVRVEFEDDGPGIPAERIHAVFNSFEQGDGSATRTVGGLGMGLALSRELAERMAGRLGVKSAAGQGSTFSLLLPVA